MSPSFVAASHRPLVGCAQPLTPLHPIPQVEHLGSRMNRLSHARPFSVRMGRFASSFTRALARTPRSNPTPSPVDGETGRREGERETRGVPLLRAQAVRAIVDTWPPLFPDGRFPRFPLSAEEGITFMHGAGATHTTHTPRLCVNRAITSFSPSAVVPPSGAPRVPRSSPSISRSATLQVRAPGEPHSTEVAATVTIQLTSMAWRRCPICRPCERADSPPSRNRGGTTVLHRATDTRTAHTSQLTAASVVLLDPRGARGRAGR